MALDHELEESNTEGLLGRMHRRAKTLAAAGTLLAAAACAPGTAAHSDSQYRPNFDGMKIVEHGESMPYPTDGEEQATITHRGDRIVFSGDDIYEEFVLEGGHNAPMALVEKHTYGDRTDRSNVGSSGQASPLLLFGPEVESITYGEPGKPSTTVSPHSYVRGRLPPTSEIRGPDGEMLGWTAYLSAAEENPRRPMADENTTYVNFDRK